MSKEILDDLVYDLELSDQVEFPQYLDRVLYYGILEDIELAKLLDVPLEDLDELLSTSEHLSDYAWRAYRNVLVKKIKAELAKYERLYYSEQDE